MNSGAVSISRLINPLATATPVSAPRHAVSAARNSAANAGLASIGVATAAALLLEPSHGVHCAAKCRMRARAESPQIAIPLKPFVRLQALDEPESVVERRRHAMADVHCVVVGAAA